MLRYMKALFGIYDHEWKTERNDYRGRELHNIGNDWHIGSKYCDNPSLEHLVQTWIDDPSKIPPNTRLIGDIVDLKCCPPEKVSFLRRLRDKLMEILLYKLGNHDGVQGVKPSMILNGSRYNFVKTQSGRKYAEEHGHLLIDEVKKNTHWQDYSMQPDGASKLKLMKVDLFDDLDWVKARRPLPKGFIEAAAQRAIDLGVDGMIFGHFHVEAIRFYNYRGKEIIILPAHKLNEVWL